MPKEIKLTQGKFAVVDDEDFEWLSKYSWCFHKTGYAVRGQRKQGHNHLIRMHREVLGAPPGYQVDHINGNKLDNRKENLRLATNQQNHFNLPPQRKSTSGFKGVSWQKQKRKWRARIMLDGREKHLGLFTLEIEAAKAYNQAAIQFFGSFARLNEIHEEVA